MRAIIILSIFSLRFYVIDCNIINMKNQKGGHSQENFSSKDLPKVEVTSEAERSHPYLVSIQDSYENETNNLCNGVILSPNKILTEASCVNNHITQTQKYLFVTAGASRTEHLDKFRQKRSILKVILHPKFNMFDWINSKLAVVYLDLPLHFNSYVNSVQLPSNDYVPSGSCVLTGWDTEYFENTNKKSVELKQLELPLVPYADCAKAYMKEKTSSGMHLSVPTDAICAGGHNDFYVSGAPLICENVLAGVSTWKHWSKSHEFPLVLSNIAKVVNWINSV